MTTSEMRTSVIDMQLHLSRRITMAGYAGWWVENLSTPPGINLWSIKAPTPVLNWTKVKDEEDQFILWVRHSWPQLFYIHIDWNLVRSCPLLQALRHRKSIQRNLHRKQIRCCPSKFPGSFQSLEGAAHSTSGAMNIGRGVFSKRAKHE